MRRSVIGTILATILILGAVGAVGYGLWNSGYQQGAIVSRKLQTRKARTWAYLSPVT